MQGTIFMRNPLFIAHRGNTSGAQPSFENKIEYLYHALDQNYGIEVDVREHNGKLYFGHDEPQEEINWDILTNKHSFVHLKNQGAVELLFDRLDIMNMFWHDDDKMTFTTYGNIWCYPNVFVNHSSAIWLELGDTSFDSIPTTIYGVCADKIKDWKFI